MSNEIERFFELQDEATKAAFVESRGDELTDILVAALEDVFAILADDDVRETIH
ncbi:MULTISPECIES: hypothetical protein [Rhizobium]|uniref:Uncharacterized protein n=1 Tax=Rhizobium favelukesii TaxID=348824 RepID=W6RCD0_9HYPH|nr:MULTISPECIES: hypothetical protein [Rhizobium]MCA0802539.1 hypothetical protein [Rhizobium sp. T1473]MCS0460449.1 hypothetical protein [Rhizobium favelukesii]UFS83869.1 hypothetical protein LPB79_16935 [Rhizobium sp. T136]CDM58499.1 hypothetical protein LPU83_2848 [Rhizobium favelukesii]